MPRRDASLQPRTTLVGLMLAILAVLGLDATAIVAAPSTEPAATPQTASLAPPPPSGLRIIKWSGRSWLVYPNSQNGPEPGVKMSDSKQSVYVDAKGRLHLTIVKVKGVWRSVELRAMDPLGPFSPATYGTYRWAVRGSTAKFSRNTVLGMFVYQSTGRKLSDEIDIEDSRFTHWIRPNNASYTVQPYYAEDYRHWCTFRTPKRLKKSTQQFTWAPGQVTFATSRGAGSKAKPLRLRCRSSAAGNPAGPSGRSFTYTGADVPKPDSQHLYINLWTNMNRPPTHGKRSIVLDSFSFTPLAP